MAIPSYFKRLFREYVTGVGSSEVADQSPVQSVNGNTGDVTITTADPDNTLAGGDTRTVSAGRSLTISGDYTVDGALDVDGVVGVHMGRINGTGTITGTGTIVGSET